MNLDLMAFFQEVFIKSTDHRPPTTYPPTTYPPTHQPSTYRSTDAVIMFKRFENSKIFTLQNISTAGKMKNVLRSII